MRAARRQRGPSLRPPRGRLGTGPSLRPPRGRLGTGFTLLELLIVIVIMGLMATFAVLSLGSRALDERLDTEARRINELIALAAEEAVLQGTELGFVHTAEGYVFRVLKDGKWQPLDEVAALRDRSLEEPFFLELRIEDRPVGPATLDDEKIELKPQVLLLSSGEMTAFKLNVRARRFKVYFELQGDLLGRLRLERKEEVS